MGNFLKYLLSNLFCTANILTSLLTLIIRGIAQSHTVHHAHIC